MKIWMNGELIDSATTGLRVESAGATLGWGVYTTLGVWQKRSFVLERHLQRLRHDAACAEILLPHDDEALGSAVTEVVEANQVERGLVRITLLRRGDGRWCNEEGSDLLIFAKATPPSQSEPSTQRLRLVLSPFRLESRRALSGVKSTSYLDYQLAWQRATRSGFDDAVLCNGNGALCECTRANIFWVRDGQLHTPGLDSGCLPGIARELVLHWATEDGVAIKEGTFSPQELAGADEAFLTSATQGPRAVAWLAVNEQDDSPHEFAAPGSLTVRLQQRWQIAVQGQHKGQPGRLTVTR